MLPDHVTNHEWYVWYLISYVIIISEIPQLFARTVVRANNCSRGGSGYLDTAESSCWFYIHKFYDLTVFVRLILLLTKFSSTLTSKLQPFFCQSWLKCKSSYFLTETVSMLIATKRATSFKLDIYIMVG